ncbi:MAG: Foldase protein PrsA [Chroococcopsis gigantea SAG 12.99]|jgi:parvulin-like peptidyl-prolyl isomerase|nr:Foldase protein PrsA [Chroococcopsis gigantea SAG 12.99]
MNTDEFLVVGERSLSLRESLNYLQTTGKLQSFVVDILRQYFIEEEIESRKELDVNSQLTEQAVIEFRLQNGLSDGEKFQQWLNSQSLDYGTFRKQIGFNIKQIALKKEIAKGKITQYFIERKLSLDRVVLSRIIVENKELAEELKTQVEEGGSFEELAGEYSLADDRIFKGMMGLISRAALPDELRMCVDGVLEGEIIGPLSFESRWALFKVDKSLPASLDNPEVQEILENEIFENWIAEKLKNTPVKLQVT